MKRERISGFLLFKKKKKDSKNAILGNAFVRNAHCLKIVNGKK